MKNFSNRFISFLLASLILFTSSGFSIVEQSCSMRGKKSYSFVNEDACAGCSKHNSNPNQKTTVSRNKCCESKKLDNNANLSESAINIASKFLKIATEFVSQSTSFALFEAVEVELETKNNNRNAPHSLFGNSLLHFIGQLRL